MSKRRGKAPEPKPTIWQRLERRWKVIAGVGVILGWLLLNSNASLSNLRNFPREVRKTASEFSSWYYEDAGWTGYWSSHPEGYVDLPDMRLSQAPVGIYLLVRNGEIEGMISSQAVCKSVPYDFLLLKGHVNRIGDTATVVAWDTFEGHDADIAKLKLRKDGVIMHVQPAEGTVRLFPTARVARDPSVKEWPAEFCEGMR